MKGLVGMALALCLGRPNAQPLCLPEAIRPAQWQNIIVDDVSMPVGIWTYDWDSAWLVTEIFRILATEVLGINTTSTGHDALTPSGWLALSGCDPSVVNDPLPQKCGQPANPHHVALETWASVDISVVRFLLANASQAAAIVVGDMGYPGHEGMWVLEPALGPAKAQQGLSLEFYATYNASWRSVTQYFTHTADIPLSSLGLCTEILCDYTTYVSATGDSAGVTVLPDGTIIPACADGHWWLSPSCRANQSKCVPLLNGGPWVMERLMQQATFHDMPLAIAMTKDWDSYLTLPRQAKTTLLYWWFPDSSFVDLAPQRMMLPEHSVEDWDKGIFRTAWKPQELTKLVSPKLQRAAPAVTSLVKGLSMSPQQIMDLLSRKASSRNSTYDTACQWLKDSRQVWERWIPKSTNCVVDSGQGLVNAGNLFVDTVAGALGCGRCVPGRFSSPWLSESSATCKICPPGQYSNAFGATSCASCYPGSIATIAAAQDGLPFSERTGSTGCTRCPEGFFQPNSSSSSCLPCNNVIRMSTSPIGSIAATDCTCPPGLYLLERATGPQCAECGAGLLCPGGLKPPLQQAGRFAREVTFNSKGVLVAPPMMVLCENEIRCPSGQPLGICPSRMFRLACDSCQAGYLMGKKECVICSSAPGLSLGLGTAGLLLLVAVICFSMSGDASKPRHDDTAIFSMAFQITLGAYQILLAFSIIELPWVEPLLTLGFLVKLALDFFGPSCVFGVTNPVARYAFMLGAAPACGCLFLLGFLVVRVCRRNVSRFAIVNLVGSLLWNFNLALGMAAVRPFLCKPNPDGSLTMALQRGVTCWDASSGHTLMVAMSIGGILAYLVAPTVTVLWAIYMWPLMVARRGGIQFLRYFDFLFAGCTTERYYTCIVVLMRNVLLVLLPVILVQSPGVMATVMIAALVFTTTLITRLWPYRLGLMNGLFLFITQMLIAILIAGLAYSDPSSDEGYSVFVVTALSVAFAVILALFVWVFYCTWTKKTHFVIFISHHKAHAAVLARWLKMELVSGGVSGPIFLDSDDLNNLDSLTDLVAHKTENLVVLLTSQTLRRPWCAYEIACAVESKVNIVPVACDDFTPITQEFLVDLDLAWTPAERALLATLGMEISQIRAAYEFLRTLPVIELKRSLRLESQRAVVPGIVSACKGIKKSRNLFLELARDQQEAPLALVADSRDPEMNALKVVVQSFLQSSLHLDVKILEPGESIGAAECLVVLLSKDALTDASLAQFVTTASASNCCCVPVIADRDFEIPEEKFLQAVSSSLVFSPEELGSVAPARVAKAFKKLFKTLALQVSPHASESTLRAEVEHLARRLECELQVLRQPTKVALRRDDSFMPDANAQEIALSDSEQSTASFQNEEVALSFPTPRVRHVFMGPP